MSTAPLMEPSPFDDDDGDPVSRVPKRRPTDPFPPLSNEELERITKIAPGMRLIDPWRCVYNLSATDGSLRSGIGGAVRQCRTRLADPTRSRYCYEHATQLGVASYSPEEATQLIAAESAANLYRLVPKALKTLEDVMDDDDAPQGIRAKAADSVLDRTGYSKGIDLHIDATVSVEDPMEKLRSKLGDLREAQFAAAERMMSEVIDVEVVHDSADDESPV